MTEIIVDIQAESVEQVLLHIEEKLSPVGLEGWMKSALEPIFAKAAINRFYNEGDSAVGRWAPLSPATVSIRQSLGYPGAHPINVRTGALESYITQANAAVEPGEGEVTMTWPGSQVPGELEDRLRGAQSGGVSDSGRPYPARPVLGVGETDLADVHEALIAYLFIEG